MSKKKSCNRCEAAAAVFCIYLFLNLIPFMFGLMVATSSRYPEETPIRVSRIGYFFPGYRLGYWLGSPTPTEPK